MTTSKKDQQEVQAVQAQEHTKLVVYESESMGRVWLYLKGHPGVKVELPVRANSAEQAAVCVREYLDYFQPFDPSLEPGQHRATIVGVIRRKQISKDGVVSIALDLYVDDLITKFKTSTVYLDDAKPHRRAAFERVSGLLVEKMPEWDDKPLDWTSNSFQRFVCKPGRPFEIIQKDNPDYNPEKPTEAPKRVFVGFVDPQTGSVIGGIDEEKALAALALVPKPLDVAKDETFGKSRQAPAQPSTPAVQSSTPARQPEQEKPQRETRSLDCVRIDVSDRRDGKKGKVLRFYSSFDDPNPTSVISFTREPLRDAVGPANDDFFFQNRVGQPWEKVLEENGSYYPNRLISVAAERHDSTRVVKEDGKEKEEKFFYFLVMNAYLTGQPNVIPDIPF